MIIHHVRATPHHFFNRKAAVADRAVVTDRATVIAGVIARAGEKIGFCF